MFLGVALPEDIRDVLLGIRHRRARGRELSAKGIGSRRNCWYRKRRRGGRFDRNLRTRMPEAQYG